ncbi:uncharacterized protein TRAVEDRAFT_21468 [Trametes versicolor FP-101664 SS1]|uniref:uncharacterized protein n=1 Tax=Trametes versicolor (strain FP-101664) TaxID=717944 RepID=UPI000462459B|nr:uncharacterized protein TRAVEDRAFT_21468 [Trametes versicolor FP-101664 SS1]EIW58052.1 hypothetical protein TRAVEDRAFT_21468 [Trametes versicolor FP-101664 SS1]
MSNYASERQADQDFSYKTGNYPPPNDTTSSGGYGSADTFAPHSQRHADPTPASSNSNGLIDQSLDGGPVGRELQDAKQGADPRAREAFAHEARRDFAPGSQGQYGESVQSREEAGEKLATGYADQRGRQYEGGGAASGEGDQGAF